jgi:hypothetical protein
MRRSLAACFVLAGALVSPSVAGAATITLNYTASAIVFSFPLGITPGDLVTGTFVSGAQIRSQAARSYSWSSPPRRSRRFTAVACVSVQCSIAGRPFGGASSKLR